jgi:hypothetical protein
MSTKSFVATHHAGVLEGTSQVEESTSPHLFNSSAKNNDGRSNFNNSRPSPNVSRELTPSE